MGKIPFIVFFISLICFSCEDKLENNPVDPVADEKMSGLYASAKANIADPDKAFEEAMTLLRLARENKSNTYIGEASNIIGVIQRDKNNYVESLQSFLKSSDAFEIAMDTAGMAKVYNNIGNLYRDILRYDQAILFYQKSLTAKTLLRDKQGMAITNRNMAFVFQLKGDYERAKDSYWTSLYTWKTLGNEERTAQLYNDLGIIYDLMSQDENNIENGIEKNIIYNLHKNSLELYEKANNQRGIGWAYNNIATSLIGKEAYEEALEYLEKTISLKIDAEDKNGLTHTFNNLGYIYLNYHRDPDKAITFFQQAEKYAELQDLQKTYEFLAKALEQKGKYDTAILYIKKLNQLKEELQNDKYRQELAKIEARYSVEYAGL